MVEEDTKRVCSHCLRNDPVLIRIIANDQNSTKQCDYCSNKDQTMSMSALGNTVDWLIEQYYSLGEVDDEYGDPEGSPLLDILEKEVSSNIGVIEDLSKILADCWYEWGTQEHKYGEDPHFISAITIPHKLSNKWALMEKKLRESNRFFNHDALETFDEVFGYLFDNHPSAFIDFTPNTPIYRGRIFKSEDDIEFALQMPESRLGPPPSDLAPYGRMNAKGISVFYGATSKTNAVSEVRPPVGSFVVVSEFRVLRPVRLLDLTVLGRVTVNGVSRFDPEYLVRYERSRFIATLSRKLVMPVVPELAESNYLLTQAIADYLSITEKYSLDGIKFSSAQMPSGQGEENACNVILFHKSSVVKNAKLRRLEVQVSMYREDDDYAEFDPQMITTNRDFRRQFTVLSRNKPQQDVLELKLGSIEIHEIRGVKYTSLVTPVGHKEISLSAAEADISHAKSSGGRSSYHCHREIIPARRVRRGKHFS
ncbi:RES domain-containing protein, partial [Salmonella enterica]|nr:RES domain-containing protein [Salmonella enterica]